MRFTTSQKPTSGSVTSFLMFIFAFSMTNKVFSAPIGNTQELTLRDSSNNQNNSSPVGYNNHNDDNNDNNDNNAYYSNNQIPNIAPQGAKVIPIQINNPNVPPPTVQNSVSSNNNGQGGMVDIQMPVEEFNAIKMALMNSITPQGQFQQNQGGDGGSGAIIRPVQIAPGSNPNSDPAPLVPINNNGTPPTSSSSTSSSTSTSTATQTPTATPSPPASDDSDSRSGSS